MKGWELERVQLEEQEMRNRKEGGRVGRSRERGIEKSIPVD